MIFLSCSVFFASAALAASLSPLIISRSWLALAATSAAAVEDCVESSSSSSRLMRSAWVFFHVSRSTFWGLKTWVICRLAMASCFLLLSSSALAFSSSSLLVLSCAAMFLVALAAAVLTSAWALVMEALAASSSRRTRLCSSRSTCPYFSRRSLVRFSHRAASDLSDDFPASPASMSARRDRICASSGIFPLSAASNLDRHSLLDARLRSFSARRVVLDSRSRLSCSTLARRVLCSSDAITSEAARSVSAESLARASSAVRALCSAWRRTRASSCWVSCSWHSVASFSRRR
mmetsp:Transcript_16152/g.50785  ORF Transcript_16152/g.50785 Transcript_16152/m.50785 type:complete len:291 (-) Transcript_16152:3788-4660(-)